MNLNPSYENNFPKKYFSEKFLKEIICITNTVILKEKVFLCFKAHGMRFYFCLNHFFGGDLN